MILLVSEVEGSPGKPESMAKGTVIEATRQGEGPSATLLTTRTALSGRNVLAAGPILGKVRANGG